MNRKCHNHTLKTNPRHRGEEAKTDNSRMTQVKQPSLSPTLSLSLSLSLSLFPSGMIAKLEKTQSTAQQNKDLLQKQHKQWEQQKQ